MHGWKLHTFCHAHWPGMQIWNRDVDRLAPPELVRDMATGTGESVIRAHRTTLRTFEGVLFERLPQSAGGLMTSIGVYHRARRGYGLRYCPRCLDEEPTAYFRKAWRVLNITTCLEHGVQLRDSCPDCDAPIIPSRGDFLGCHACGGDIRDTLPRPASSSALAADWHMRNVLTDEAVNRPFLQGLHPIAYCALLYRLMLLLACGPRRDRLHEVLAGCGVKIPELDFSQSPASLRFLRVHSIHGLMEAMEFLLRGWPAMFAGVMQEANIWKSWALRDAEQAETPYVYIRAVNDYLIAN